MDIATQNPLNAPVSEIPNPPDEFGEDGGKFYRAYDALTDEIDEDNMIGLKEHLDAMVVFVSLPHNTYINPPH